jgi:hypothetical protein
LDQLTSKQLSEWEAYDRLDPIGTWRDDFRMSFMASLLTNLTIKVNGRKGAALTNVKDFLLDWSGDLKIGKQQSIEDMKTVLLQIAKDQNRKVSMKEGKTLPVKKQKP